MDGDPLRELIGKPLSRVKAGRNWLTLVFDKDDTAIELEVTSKAQLTGAGAEASFPSRAFTKQLKGLRGSGVSDALHVVGLALEIKFDRDETLRISLKAGDFHGLIAARVRVPGKAQAAYHDSGSTTLSLRL